MSNYQFSYLFINFVKFMHIKNIIFKSYIIKNYKKIKTIKLGAYLKHTKKLSTIQRHQRKKTWRFLYVFFFFFFFNLKVYLIQIINKLTDN